MAFCVIRLAAGPIAVIVAMVWMTPTPEPTLGRVVVLLAEGRLSVLDVTTGATTATFAVSPSRANVPVGRIAATGRGPKVFAILPRDDGTSSTVVFDVDTMTGRVIGSLPPDTYPALAVGERSGRLYAFRSRNATVLVLDPVTGAILADLSDQPGRGSVYSAAVSSDERRIYVSYHGEDSGIDVFVINDKSWRREGHISAHGNFALLDRTLLLSQGTESFREVDQFGQTVKVLSNGLVGNHVMEFALDRQRAAVFAVGSCLYAGGLSRVDRSNRELHVIVAPGRIALKPGLRTHSVCGERIAVSSDGTWVATTALTTSVTPSSARPGTILIVDTKTGTVIRELKLSSEPIDIWIPN